MKESNFSTNFMRKKKIYRENGNFLAEIFRYWTDTNVAVFANYFSLNHIEDEAHFLIKCDKLNNKREELFKLISSKVKNFTKLFNNQKLYYILTCQD
jgi:hypothetical protein